MTSHAGLGKSRGPDLILMRSSSLFALQIFDNTTELILIGKYKTSPSNRKIVQKCRPCKNCKIFKLLQAAKTVKYSNYSNTLNLNQSHMAVYQLWAPVSNSNKKHFMKLLLNAIMACVH